MSRPSRAAPFLIGGNLVLALVVGGAAYGLHERHLSENEEIREAWTASHHDAALDTSHQVEVAVRTIYAGVRTMARLPSVRNVLTTGAPLSDDARVTVQELYNSLATAVDVSEVYLVPLALDPDAGPTSTAPREPVVTFDDLIVGTAADHEEAGGPELEEIEIHEYRAMREQLAWFAANARADAGLSVPLLTSARLVTCDNRHVDPAHIRDDDRTGFVLSVPAYGADGRLIGAVSAVVLERVVAAMVPPEATLLMPRGQVPLAGGAATEPGFDELVPLDLPIGEAPWRLRSTAEAAAFAALPAVAGETLFCRVGVALLVLGGLLVGGGASFAWLRQVRERSAVRRILAVAGAAASGRLEARSRVVGDDVPGRLGAAFDSLTDSMERSIVAMVQTGGRLEAAVDVLTPSTDAIARTVGVASTRAGTASAGTGRLLTQVGQIASGIEQMQGMVRRITDEAQATASVAEEAVTVASDAAQAATRLVVTGEEIGEIATQITDIAAATRMLALNASIEAARAGASGRGFTVVASQVRELADQTARAADIVQQRVDAIRMSSQEMHARMGSIQGVVGEIAQRQRVIGEAVMEQAAATAQMARASSEVAADAEAVGESIQEAAQATEEAALAAVRVAQAGQGVAGSTRELREACSWYQA